MADYLRLLASAPLCAGISARCVLMSPPLAEALLALNTRNRKISDSVVEKYVKEILNGEWYANCHGIGVDSTGVLTDGQQRLMAIIQSGQAVPMLVVTGLPPASQEKVDRQRKRTLFDVFYLAGIADNRKAVQIATFLAYRCDRSMWRGTPPDSDVKAALETHREAIERIVDLMPSSDAGLSAAGVMAALAIAWEAMPDRTEEFIAKIKQPTGLANDDPPYRWLRWVNSPKAEKGGHRRQTSDFEGTCAALNAWLNGRKITSIRPEKDIVIAPEFAEAV